MVTFGPVTFVPGSRGGHIMVELSSGAVESLLHAWDMEERRDRHHPIHFKNTALLNYYFPPRPQRFFFNHVPMVSDWRTTSLWEYMCLWEMFRIKVSVLRTPRTNCGQVSVSGGSTPQAPQL